jgi:hypothetical protein
MTLNGSSLIEADTGTELESDVNLTTTQGKDTIAGHIIRKLVLDSKKLQGNH